MQALQKNSIHKPINDRWPILLLVIVFIAFKIPHLSYPYFWDESWPYAPAIKGVLDHGISLMPTALDPELSRGHPLFFHAAGAAWMKVFGDSFISMHSFALTISVLLLIIIFETGIKLFNRRTAIFAVMFTATFPLFFLQSAFVLFEVLVAFLCFASLAFYVSERYLSAIVCLTLAFYTKESCLIMGFIIGIHALISVFNTSLTWRVRVIRIAAIGVPCVLVGLFFIVQKHYRGWYIFPFYNKLIEHNWYNFWYNFRRNSFRNTFCEFNNYYHYLVLLAMAIVAAIRKKTLWSLTVFLPAAVIFLMVDDRRGGDVQLSYVLLPALVVSVAIMLYGFRKMNLYSQPKQALFVELSICFIIAFLCFSSLNFFTYRYLLASFIPLFFVFAIIIDKFVTLTNLKLYIPILTVIVGINIYTINTDHEMKDSSLDCLIGMEIQQKEIEYFTSHNYYGKRLGIGGFITFQHLIDPATGFLNGARPFDKKDIKWDIDGETLVTVFDNIENDYRYHEVKADTSFHCVYRYEKGKYWGEIYERIYRNR